jgi:hypothetical protein
MNTPARLSARHRLIGLALAVAGVALNRHAAPACPEAWRDVAALAGQLVVVARGVRLRILNSAATSPAPDAALNSPAPR